MANPLGCGVPSLLRGWVWIGCVVALAAAGCGSSSSGGGGTGGSGGGATGGTGGSGGGSATRLVVTADWLNQSLTLLDYERLTDGQSTGEESIVGTIDLSDYEPGPLEL